MRVLHKDRLRKYALTSRSGQRAIEVGLADAQWFHPNIPRQRLKQLMQRNDGQALVYTAMWLGGLIVSAGLAILTWGTWWTVPFLLMYGLLYASASDSRWHEAGHGTPFKTRWLSTVVYQLSCFMLVRDPTFWRWSHARHHTDTIIVGRDPEILAMRPARLARIGLNFFGLVDFPQGLWLMLRHAAGQFTVEDRLIVPASELYKIPRTARIWVLIYLGMIVACFATGSILPFLLIGGPRLYGSFMLMIYSLTQHTGLGENVLDHRLNTRTVKMCWLNRFMYWNMNYHIEHHLYPMVPFHQLPALHEEIKKDLPEPYPSLWAAYREILPAVVKQLRDPSYYVRRELPPGAAPYYEPISIDIVDSWEDQASVDTRKQL